MRVVALVVLLAFSAYAEDAPLRAMTAEDLTTTRAKVMLSELSPEEKLAVARYIVSLETENVELKTAVKSTMHPVVFVGIIVLAVVVGGAAGYGIAKVTK